MNILFLRVGLHCSMDEETSSSGEVHLFVLTNANAFSDVTRNYRPVFECPSSIQLIVRNKRRTRMKIPTKSNQRKTDASYTVKEARICLFVQKLYVRTCIDEEFWQTSVAELTDEKNKSMRNKQSVSRIKIDYQTVNKYLSIAG